MAAQDLPQSPAPDHPSYQLPEGCGRTSWRAMGTTLLLCVPLAHLNEAECLARDLFATWEGVLSRFRDDSELSVLNHHAGRAMKVSDLLWRVLITALDAARATGGLYDPALGRQMIRIGYDRSFNEITDGTVPEANIFPLPGGGWQRVQLDDATHMVCLPAGIALDFGGIAKGMAVDAAIALLAERGISPVLLNAGGDLAVQGAPKEGWGVALPGGRVITLTGGALATSGIDRRAWQQGARQRHHIIDPRTGEPVANGVVAATAVARRCAQAEVAAKVALILGERDGLAFLQRHRLAGQLLLRDGRILATDGWPLDSEVTS